MVLRRVLLALWLLTALNALFAAEFAAGDAAVAERYEDWAIAAISGGRWTEAEAALERASDFANVSSDLSYLLALVRSHKNRPRGAVLDAARQGIETNRWNRYSAVHARLLEAEALLDLRAFTKTLQTLSQVSASDAERYGADIVCLRLRALLGLKDIPAFLSAATTALEEYYRNPGPARILLRYAAKKAIPEALELDLIETILKRLPLLLEEAPDLAYLAAPFVQDAGEARRLVAAYRASGGADPEAIPVAINLGIIDDDTAVKELFHLKTQNKDLILDVWKLLRGPGGRKNFRRNLSNFSGVIQEDADSDGFFEATTKYGGGVIEEYAYDTDQDGIFEWRIFWSAGVPVWAGIAVPPEKWADTPQEGAGLPHEDADSSRASIVWERYPAVLSASLRELTYRFSTGKFTFSPFLITEIPESGGLPYPEREPRGARLTERTLASFAVSLERPSREFSGAIERIALELGVPKRAVEYIGDKMVSVTEFLRGRPVVQRIDLDLDGRMETVRRFSARIEVLDPERGYNIIPESSENDWDGDGVYETGEEYFPDGSSARSWDLDNDGNREYTVVSPAQEKL
jgi:hypothetical protein